MGKPVGLRFGQMVRKIQDWLISSQNRIYHLYKSVPFTEKRPRRPETGIKPVSTPPLFYKVNKTALKYKFML